MSDLDAIRSELVSRISTVTTSHGALRASKYALDAVNPPQAVVAEDDPFIDYDQTFETGDKFNFRVIVYASRVTETHGQALLDGLRVGPGSLREAINASWTAETAAFYATVHSAGPVQRYTFGQTDYLGCEFQIEVVAD